MSWTYTFEGRPGHRRRVTKTGLIRWQQVLSQNAWVHPQTKFRQKKHDQELVAQTVRHNAPPAPLERARLTFVLHWAGDPLGRDWDNASAMFKGVLDGLVDGGVIADDRMRVIGQPEIVFAPLDPGQHDWYEIIVEEAPRWEPE